MKYFSIAFLVLLTTACDTVSPTGVSDVQFTDSKYFSYCNYVADKFDIRKDVRFDTNVVSELRKRERAEMRAEAALRERPA